MSSGMFLGPLYLRYQGNGRWQLTQSLTFKSNGRSYTAPQGFETDLDSIPRIPILHAWLKSRATKSAVIHDFLYHKLKNRKTADKVMLAAMAAEGVKAWRRLPIYWGVRLFGWLHYWRHGRG